MSQVLELATELISCASVTPDDSGCQSIVAARLTRHGFRVQHMPFGAVQNLWAIHGDDGPTLCFAGHTDVVPPGPRDAWSSDPFVPTLKDGFLYGRGASDMKASVAAMVVAAERLAGEGHPGRIAVLLTSDEEGPGKDGTKRVLAELLDRGIQIEGAIVGEPTSDSAFGDAIKVGRRGSMTGLANVVGLQGHTAYPGLARNAIHLLAPALLELSQLEWEASAPWLPTTLQICNLQAGTGASNVVPGQATVQFNVRFGSDHTPQSIQQRVGEILSRYGLPDALWEVSALPFVTEPGPLTAALESAVMEGTGQAPLRSTGGGTSDARFFASHGIPVAEFGPLNDTIHAADERVEVDCLEPLANIYCAAASKFWAAESQHNCR